MTAGSKPWHFEKIINTSSNFSPISHSSVTIKNFDLIFFFKKVRFFCSRWAHPSNKMCAKNTTPHSWFIAPYRECVKTYPDDWRCCIAVVDCCNVVAKGTFSLEGVVVVVEGGPPQTLMPRLPWVLVVTSDDFCNLITRVGKRKITLWRLRSILTSFVPLSILRPLYVI